MSSRKKPSDRELTGAVFHTLKDEGLLLPKSPEEVEALEQEFGKYPKTKLNPEDALRIAKTVESHSESVIAPEVAQFSQFIEREFGVAARKGAPIPPEVWAKMRADRKKAEEERRSGHGSSE